MIWGLFILIVFLAIIYGAWWALIKEPPGKKAFEMVLSLVGGIVFCCIFGGLVFGLCYWIVVDVDHLPFRL